MPLWARNFFAVRDFNAPLRTAAMFAALWCIMLGLLPLQENSDGLLQTVISLQKLTVYFWGQDRFGDLLPAVTVWIHNPSYNAHAQLSLRVLFGLLAPVFFCSLAFRRPLDVWRATFVTDCLLVIVANPALTWEIYIEASPYGPSLATAGIAALTSRAASMRQGTMRLILLVIAVGCMLTAYVVNFALALITLPLAGLLALLLPSLFMRRLLMLHLFAAVLGFLLPRIVASEYHTVLEPDIALHNYTLYLGVLWSNTRWSFAAAAGLPLLLFLTLAGRGRGRSRRVSAAILSVMLAAVTFFFVAIASTRWLVMSQFHQRYFIPGYLLLMSIGGISTWQLFRHRMRDQPARGALFAGLSYLLLIIAFGRWQALGLSTHEVIGDGKAPLANAVAGRTAAVSLDGIAGDYWLVWPSVFMAEQYRYDVRASGGAAGTDIFGITFRGDARQREFAARLAARGELRVGCIDVADCTRFIASTMTLPGLRGAEFAPSERLPDNHVLSFIAIAPPEAEHAQKP